MPVCFLAIDCLLGLDDLRQPYSRGLVYETDSCLYCTADRTRLTPTIRAGGTSAKVLKEKVMLDYPSLLLSDLPRYYSDD